MAQALDHLFNGKSSSNKSVLDQLKVTRTNLAGFYIKTSVTWHEILILIDVQLSDSSSDEVAEAFCLGQRRGCRTERAEKPAKRCPR